MNILIPGIRQGIHSAGICWELTLSQPATIFTKNPHLAKQPAAAASRTVGQTLSYRYFKELRTTQVYLPL